MIHATERIPVVAGIETGGTKIVCGFARIDSPNKPYLVERFATTSPDETITRIRRVLDCCDRPIAALGLASFGPVNVEPGPRYGWITSTTKPGWSDVPLLARVRPAHVPAVVLNDVAAAVLAEQRRGAGRGATRVGYATVGTGIGVGLVVNGRVLAGDGWPELGHLLVRRHPDDTFAGSCPYHRDCLEGLASGPAVAQRWGADGSSLGSRTGDAVTILSFYLAQLVAAIALTIGIQRVILGGGVMATPGLLSAIRQLVPDLLGGPAGGHSVSVDDPGLIVAPTFRDAGLVGALIAAADLSHRSDGADHPNAASAHSS